PQLDHLVAGLGAEAVRQRLRRVLAVGQLFAVDDVDAGTGGRGRSQPVGKVGPDVAVPLQSGEDFLQVGGEVLAEVGARRQELEGGPAHVLLAGVPDKVSAPFGDGVTGWQGDGPTAPAAWPQDRYTRPRLSRHTDRSFVNTSDLRPLRS